jgi:pyruvate carboxylase
MLDQRRPGEVRGLDAGAEAVLITDTTMRDGHQSLLATRCAA